MMGKSVELLMSRHKYVSMLAAVSLISIVVSLCLVALSAILELEPQEIGHVVGSGLGVALVSSLVCMPWATLLVLRSRAELADWGLFLVVVWFIPYFGISFCLGGPFILNVYNRMTVR